MKLNRPCQSIACVGEFSSSLKLMLSGLQQVTASVQESNILAPGRSIVQDAKHFPLFKQMFYFKNLNCALKSDETSQILFTQSLCLRLVFKGNCGSGYRSDLFYVCLIQIPAKQGFVPSLPRDMLLQSEIYSSVFKEQIGSYANSSAQSWLFPPHLMLLHFDSETSMERASQIFLGVDVQGAAHVNETQQLSTFHVVAMRRRTQTVLHWKQLQLYCMVNCRNHVITMTKRECPFLP